MSIEAQKVDVLAVLAHAEQALALLTSIRFPDGCDNDRIRGVIALSMVNKAMKDNSVPPLRDLIAVHEFKSELALARVGGATTTAKGERDGCE